MSTYSINFTNNSSSTGSFCIFQQKPGEQSGNAYTLAWRAQFADLSGQLTISWLTDLYFFWAKTGALGPDTIFRTGGLLLTSLSENNAVTLIKTDTNYSFQDQRDWNQPGVLAMSTDSSIPINQASLGIGMSGTATLAMQALPNMMYVFAPKIQYWVIFGNFTQGQVLDSAQLEDAVQVVFPYGIFSMNATLNKDNSWTITQGDNV